jgi:hypothetical protein
MRVWRGGGVVACARQQRTRPLAVTCTACGQGLVSVGVWVCGCVCVCPAAAAFASCDISGSRAYDGMHAPAHALLCCCGAAAHPLAGASLSIAGCCGALRGCATTLCMRSRPTAAWLLCEAPRMVCARVCLCVFPRCVSITVCVGAVLGLQAVLHGMPLPDACTEAACARCITAIGCAIPHVCACLVRARQPCLPLPACQPPWVTSWSTRVCLLLTYIQATCLCRTSTAQQPQLAACALSTAVGVRCAAPAPRWCCLQRLRCAPARRAWVLAVQEHAWHWCGCCCLLHPSLSLVLNDSTWVACGRGVCSARTHTYTHTHTTRRPSCAGQCMS